MVIDDLVLKVLRDGETTEVQVLNREGRPNVAIDTMILAILQLTISKGQTPRETAKRVSDRLIEIADAGVIVLDESQADA